MIHLLAYGSRHYMDWKMSGQNLKEVKMDEYKMIRSTMHFRKCHMKRVEGAVWGLSRQADIHHCDFIQPAVLHEC